MSKKMTNVEAVENAKRNQIDEMDGFKLGEEVWAWVADGSIGTGKISGFHDSPSGKSATFYDVNGGKFRTVYTADLSREALKGRRKAKGKGAAGEATGIMKLRIQPGENA